MNVFVVEVFISINYLEIPWRIVTLIIHQIIINVREKPSTRNFDRMFRSKFNLSLPRLFAVTWNMSMEN